MKLEKFITETINQIISGISKTHEQAKKHGATINPRLASSEGSRIVPRSPIHTVEFDVAVTTKEGKGTKGGFGVFVGPIGAGSQGKSESSNSSVSRIKFSIPVVFPTQDM
jgi:hypothetical protein